MQKAYIISAYWRVPEGYETGLTEQTNSLESLQTVLDYNRLFYEGERGGVLASIEAKVQCALCSGSGIVRKTGKRGGFGYSPSNFKKCPNCQQKFSTEIVNLITDKPLADCAYARVTLPSGAYLMKI